MYYFQLSYRQLHTSHPEGPALIPGLELTLLPRVLVVVMGNMMPRRRLRRWRRRRLLLEKLL